MCGMACFMVIVYTDRDAEYTYAKLLYLEHKCEKNGGLKSYDAFTATCKNGAKLGYEFKN